MDLLLVFGLGRAILLIGLIVVVVSLFYTAYRSSKSGSKVQNGKTGQWQYSDKNVSITKSGYFWLGIIASAFLVYMIIEMISEL